MQPLPLIILGRSSAYRAVARHIPVIALMLAASLTGCWDDGPIPEEEEDAEILIGSSQPTGGGLLTAYDFGVPVALNFSTELPGVRIYSGTDPGFVSLGSDATDEPYGLPDGVEVTVRVTEIDSGVRLIFNDAALAQAGDATRIGTTPIHIHAQWQLILDETASPAPHFIGFTFSAPGYAESPEYTATLIVADDDHHDEDDHHDAH